MVNGIPSMKTSLVNPHGQTKFDTKTMLPFRLSRSLKSFKT